MNQRSAVKIIRIGRSSQCDFIIADPTVSRLHAELHIYPDGRLYLQDTNSMAGIKIISRNAQVVQFDKGWVDAQDRIYLGKIKVKIAEIIQELKSNYPPEPIPRHSAPPPRHGSVPPPADNPAYLHDIPRINKEINVHRLPVYLLLDTSGSMKGEAIISVNVGLQSMIATLRQNPYALENVHISVTTFDSHVSDILPLTALESVNIPEVVCQNSGATLLGAGLAHICNKVNHEVRRSTQDTRGDWRPLLFIMTNGKPSDIQAFNEVIPKVKACHFTTIIACVAGPKSDSDHLQYLTDQVVQLDTMDGTTFSNFFQWVTAAVTSSNISLGVTDSFTLPLPPPEVIVN